MRVHFSLDISRSAYLSYYEGVASEVVVQTEEGFTIRFPAARLRPFVTTSGIQGRFVLEYDDINNQFQSLKRIGEN